MKDVTIGHLAEHSGVHLETIRYWQRRGLVDLPPRPLGGVRRYGAAHLDRLAFILRGQELGFSLDEIGELLTLEDGAGCARARAVGERKLAAVRSKLIDLRRLETALSTLLQQCDVASGRVQCPLVASLRRANRTATSVRRKTPRR